ncbi:MAG: Ig-like domain-containing protein, partial [Propionibacteriaceae bacterium]|nr:Ig-like domain-containing protein [Propionibacteriaceae bacterium]
PVVVWVDRASDTSLKIQWRKVAGAKSYRVYHLVKGKYKLVKTTTKLSWKAKGLAKRKAQRYRVSACATKDGKRCSAKSWWAEGIPYVSGDYYVNAGKVKIDKIPVLGLRDQWKLVYDLLPAKYGKKPEGMYKHADYSDSPTRYMSSDMSVVSVGKLGGRLTAKKVGKAKVTVVAPNGRRASVTVRVADRAEPVVDTEAGNPWFADASGFVAAHKDRLARLARYTLSHNFKTAEAVYGLDADANAVLVKGQDPGLPDQVRDDLWHVLAENSAYPVYVHFGPGWETTVQFVYNGPWDYDPYSYSCQDFPSGVLFQYRPYIGTFPDLKTDSHWEMTGYDRQDNDC